MTNSKQLSKQNKREKKEKKKDSSVKIESTQTLIQKSSQPTISKFTTFSNR